MSEIMLSTPTDVNKVHFPAEVSIKLDGVAADFYKTPNGWVVQSRQGKPIPSAGHIVEFLNRRHRDAPPNLHVIAELTVLGVNTFKDSAGIIRRDKVDERIVMNVYDVYQIGYENEDYETRVRRITKFIAACSHPKLFLTLDGVTYPMVRRVPVTGIVQNKNELQAVMNEMPGILDCSPIFEGLMIRCLRGPDSRYKIGKRSRNMMKFKPKPTVDLQIVDLEEATANKEIVFLGETFQKGDGLRAVGRVIALYKGEEIGVGPGSLTHEERRELWTRYLKLKKQGKSLRDAKPKLIAEIEYSQDESYTALREARFKRWRPDKTEPNENG